MPYSDPQLIRLYDVDTPTVQTMTSSAGSYVISGHNGWWTLDVAPES